MRNLTARLLVAVALSVVLTACAPPSSRSPEPAAVNALGSAPAATQVDFFATLCFGDPSNSFDCVASRLASHLAESDHTADTSLNAHRISTTEAAQIRDEVHTSKVLLDKALDVCRITNKTGECTRDSNLAHELLDQAQTAAAGLP